MAAQTKIAIVPVVDKEDGRTIVLPGGPFVTQAVAAGGANPKGPLGMPLHGPFAGPIG